MRDNLSTTFVGWKSAILCSWIMLYSTGSEAAPETNSRARPVLNWNTFLGGSGSENGYSIAIDSGGNIYLGGTASATWGSPVRAYSASSDAFVVKLDNDGSIVWSTFIGGSGSDDGYAIDVDSSGNVYLAGYSNQTWGSPVQEYTASSSEAFAVKLDSNGGLLWNTFLGGSGGADFDYGRAIATDSGGNVYVVGESAASWGAPVRAFGGSKDGFAAKLNSSGSLVWNTFLGGAG